jgi:hypothetical protein
MAAIIIAIWIILRFARENSGKDGGVQFDSPFFSFIIRLFKKSHGEKREMQEIHELLILIKDEMALRRIMDSVGVLISALPRRLGSPFRKRLARVEIVGTPQEIASQLLPLIADLVHVAGQRGISVPQSLEKMASVGRLPSISRRELPYH